MISKVNLRNRFNNYIILANDFLYEESYLKAYDAFEKAYSFSINITDKVDALFEMADILLILENYEKAKDIYEKIIMLDESRSGAYYGMALVNDFLGGKVEKSIEFYKKAIKYDKNYDRAYYYLAHTYDKIGDKENALKNFYKCVEIDPMDFITYNDIGSIYEERGNLTEAKKFCNKSLSISPEYFRALFNMGVIARKMGDSDKAMDYYIRAKESYPDPYIYLNMSAIFIERADFEGAIRILNEGIDFNPDSVNLFYNRACSKANLGRIEEAVKDLREAIKINPDSILWAKEDPDLMNIVKGDYIW